MASSASPAAPACAATRLEAGVVSGAFDGAGFVWFGLSNGSVACWDGESSPVSRKAGDAIVLALTGLDEGCLFAGDSGVLSRVDRSGIAGQRPLGREWIEHLLHHGPSGRIAAVTPRRLLLLESFDGLCRTVDTLSGAPTGAAMSHAGNGVALSHRQGFSIFPWDGTAPANHVMRGAVRSLAWRLDGRYLCGPTQDGDIQVWQPADDGEFLLASEWGRAALPCWSADGGYLGAATGGRLMVWRFTKNGEDTPTRKDFTMPEDTSITALAWHPFHPTLAVGLRNGGVRVRALSSGRDWVVGEDGRSAVSVLVWSRDGRSLAAAREDGSVLMVSPPG